METIETFIWLITSVLKIGFLWALPLIPIALLIRLIENGDDDETGNL